MTYEENVKVILVRDEGKRPVWTRGIWQYDVGHEMQFEGFEGLPETFQVHFAASEDGDATTQIGQNGACALPDMYAQSSGTIYAWIYVADEETGLTRKDIRIPVMRRARITDQEPTPEEQSAIDQAIAALNEGVERAETARREAVEAKEAAAESESNAEGWAAGTRGGVVVPDTDPTWHNNAKYYAEQAGESERKTKDSEGNAARSESNAEGWAAGTRGGVAVPDTDPTWHNNAKYYAEQAGEHERDAGHAKEAAEDAARQAGTNADRAEQAANTAGFMEMTIDGNGHLVYLRTDQVDADFRLDEDGHLILMSA